MSSLRVREDGQIHVALARAESFSTDDLSGAQPFLLNLSSVGQSPIIMRNTEIGPESEIIPKWRRLGRISGMK
jgi:hypothetical protein